ncbi:hypothetical protein AX15_002059 [Amanita polypyramis BW_CC]|nr:hypothetical protein AX15_002059 [Amanita polypyramis BW_CC]
MEIDELATLITIAPPPFIFIHDPVSLPDTISAVRNSVSSANTDNDSTAHVRSALANGISCFAPRLLYDHVINSLANWSVEWDEGCVNWTLPHDMSSFARRWNDSFDAFIRGLKALHSCIRSSRHQAKQATDKKTRGRGKGKGKQKQVEEDVEEEVRFVIVVEYAERLRSIMPDLLVPLTRLAELTQLDLTVVFISQVRWEDMKPPLGASPDPYFIDIPPPKKEQILSLLEEYFDSMSIAEVPPISNSATYKSKHGQKVELNDLRPLPGPHHPSLRQLYAQFISVLCDVCYPFTHDPQDIQYIAAARWPGFVQPIIDEHSRRIYRLRSRQGKRPGIHLEHESADMDIEEDDDDDDDDEDLRPPTEDTRMRLSQLFKPTLTAALEELHPRLTNAAAWARLNLAPPDLDVLSLSRPSSPVKMGGPMTRSTDPIAQVPHTPRTSRALRSSVPNTPRTPYTPRTPRVTSYARTYTDDKNDYPATGLLSLPRLSKFILIAAFVASTNPAKSDIRMFGRGLDEKKRRRRRATSMKVGSGPAKVPQHLLGPMPFPLDRLVAILGALLEENDVDGDDCRAAADDIFRIPGEYTDMEISRVGILGMTIELSSVWLLHRTSAPDKLEGPTMFKCGISYEGALGLAKELDVPLDDLLWDPV